MNDQQSGITICILSFNRASYLNEALDSILSQTSKPDDIRIYDNGSDAVVFNSIKRYLDAGVKWIVAENPSGNWRANFLRAVSEVRTKYIVLMHDDDRLCVNFIEKQVNFLEKYGDAVVVSCNGYWINENGVRTGRTLFPTFVNPEVEMYKCSGDVALRYASDSCIPLSPAVYRTEILRQVNFREGYDKVADAVMFCDLADIGLVACQSSALYECRIHEGQDSNHFSAVLMGKLEEFLWTRKTEDIESEVRLHRMLIMQHTAHNLRRLLCAFSQPQPFRNVLGELSKFCDGKFSPLLAIKIVTDAVGRRISAIWKQ